MHVAIGELVSGTWFVSLSTHGQELEKAVGDGVAVEDAEHAFSLGL